MALPAPGYLSNAERTNAEMKQALEDLRDVIAKSGILANSSLPIPDNDWNNATENGVLYMAFDAENAPIPGWLAGTYWRHNELFGSQLLATFTHETPRFFIRSNLDGVWTPPVEFLSGGNVSLLLRPVGTQHIQFSEADGTFSPAKAPATLFGGTWALKFNTESIFFRTEGALAVADRVDGVQGDAIRNMTGSMQGVQRNSASADGVFSVVAQGGGFLSSNAGRTDIIQFNASNTVPTASENRVINRLIRVWERTA